MHAGALPFLCLAGASAPGTVDPVDEDECRP